MNSHVWNPWNLAVLAWKNASRHRVRSALTVAGVALGMFLYSAVETTQQSIRSATQATEGDTTLIVYRENRFCPATSRLPEHYRDTIGKIPGVESVIPVQIVVNNCGTSLDVVTFRGVPPLELTAYNPELRVVDGRLDAWKARGDAALIGKVLAQRRGLSPGESFDAAGVRVEIAAVIDSPNAQDNNVAYVHLPFLQQASRAGLGEVTQFNVRVKPGNSLEDVSRQIDAQFATDRFRTSTRPERAFFAETARELVEVAGFTRWIGWAAVLAVLSLVANAVLLVVRGRMREHAVLQTLGYSPLAVGWLVTCEGLVLGFIGGLLGVGGAFVFLRWSSFTIGSEGLTMAIVPEWPVLATGLGLALGLGLVASLYPAWRAARLSIPKTLRAA